MLTNTVSLRQAADMIGIGYQNARALADEGKLRTVLIGKRYKVHLSEVERFRLYGNYDPKIDYDALAKTYTPQNIPSREANITLPKDESLYDSTPKTPRTNVDGQPLQAPPAQLDPVEKADKHLDYPAWIRRIPKT